ncbi:type II toxin-antitoxin system HicA family toxin [bacterium]|nr:type II toxin-antitoxin system HicA family toxin [bacterium]
MVKLPRDVSGRKLAKALRKFGYEKTSQRGSHMRLETERNGRNRITVTDENAIPIGTLSDILKHVANHLNVTLEELLRILEL